ncbi:MAG: hypothetical protein AAF633_12160 [Chloroflexota bacterium]
MGTAIAFPDWTGFGNRSSLVASNFESLSNRSNRQDWTCLVFQANINQGELNWGQTAKKFDNNGQTQARRDSPPDRQRVWVTELVLAKDPLLAWLKGLQWASDSALIEL